MASPIGHGLLGAALGWGVGRADLRRDLPLSALAAFSAIAPDLDFLPGLAIGDVNRFHQGAGHSLGAAVLYALVLFLVLMAAGRGGARRAASYALIGGLAYVSHLTMDYLTLDQRPPFGPPVFWPLSSRHFMAAHPIFRGLLHGVPGDSLGASARAIFSAHNLTAVGLELALVLPIGAGAHLLASWRRKRLRYQIGGVADLAGEDAG